MRSRFIGLCVLLMTTPSLWADVRSDVGAIAQLIEDNYYDAKRAKTIAADLKQKASAGAFDRLTNPHDLAQELNYTLRPQDGHFQVNYAPDKSTPQQQAPSRLPFADAARRSNYGFRRVERLPGNIGLIEMTQAAHIEFANADDPARRAADSALALMRGADAIILDLRNNGGGAPSMVGYFVSAFVKPDANVYNVFHSREGTQSERPEVTYPQPDLDVPLFVLTSARTGSAAEAIAFTLQSCGRAQIVGDRSAGAANPGAPFRTNGYSIFISTGSPRNPINGRNWEGDGVRPDIAVSAANAIDRASIAALERVLQSPKLSASEKADAQWVREALTARDDPFEPKALAGYAGTYGPYAVAATSNALSATMGRRLPVMLVALKEDVFFDAQNPSRRFVFERMDGKIAAVRIVNSTGDEQRLRREER